MQFVVDVQSAKQGFGQKVRAVRGGSGVDMFEWGMWRRRYMSICGTTAMPGSR